MDMGAHHDVMKSALMNASRSQRRFFSSIVAKCTSSNPDCTTPPSSCEPWWVICIELNINKISRTCPQGKERRYASTRPVMGDTARYSPTRSCHFSHVQILFAIYILSDPFPSVGEAMRDTGGNKNRL